MDYQTREYRTLNKNINYFYLIKVSMRTEYKVISSGIKDKLCFISEMSIDKKWLLKKYESNWYLYAEVLKGKKYLIWVYRADKGREK